MQINVSQLLRSSIGTEREHKVNEPVDVLGDGKEQLVEGDVRLLRTHRGILVQGALKTQAELTCGRCLNSFSCPLTLNIEEEYVPTIDVVTGAALPAPEEPGSFTIDEHHVIDLTEAVQQYALLAVPMKPLCRENCAGLCQRCGCDLNERECDCKQHEIDPRWAELSKLRK